jgi:phosphatidate cytidylyltransferase
MSQNLHLRLVSAMILIPLVVAVIFMGGWIFGVFIALAFGVAYAEWFELATKTKRQLIYLILGSLYFVISFSEFVVLRLFYESGIYLIFLLMFSVWASDTGAYIFGKVFGRSKMSPTISPKKTWAGFRGALIGSALIFTLLVYAAPFLTPIIHNDIIVTWAQLPLVLFYGTIIGFVGQAGDLLVSALKRKANVKDSGSLIPGHGGLLDRIDSLLLVMPVFMVICRHGLDLS